MGYEINSYQDCIDAMMTCRKPAEGKPIHGKHVRLFKHNEDFHLVVYKKHFATITPDSVITFVMDSDRLYNSFASNMVYTMGRFLPLNLHRVGQGRYRIGKGLHYTQIKHAPEYYGGIKFDLRDGVCLNPRPDKHTLINKDARKVYLAALRKYKLGMLARLKLGVRGDISGPRYFDTSELIQWFRNGEYPAPLINHITVYAGGSSADYQVMVAVFESLIDRHRDVLRASYGVFGDANS
jgi:hypothetical protein